MSHSIAIPEDTQGLIDIDIQDQYTPSGHLSNKLVGHIRHTKLNYEKKFVDTNAEYLHKRLREQANEWIKEWTAIEGNERINKNLASLKLILKAVSGKKVVMDWGKIKISNKFLKQQPVFNEPEPILETFPPKPNIIDKLVKSWMVYKLAQQKQNYLAALETWKAKKEAFLQEIDVWNKEREAFVENQNKLNLEIDKLKEDYQQAKPYAIEKYCQFILQQSEYPIEFTRSIGTEYQESNKLLIIEYLLPNRSQIPHIKETKYSKTQQKFIETSLPESQIDSLFDNVIYQIILRSLYELFDADVINAVDSIVFNGWVSDMNQATGKIQTVCIVSLMVNKNTFKDIDLGNVDPKACFKSLKGIAASKLSGISAIPPIFTISREDKRFVQSHEVANKLDDSANIAAMDWYEFEHLVRELFEREFQPVGGEVKVLQSSRDKGVDAVVFDPDPVKGGKLIIQAKRYTNTVKIESVRALYGVMQDEGAMKGIMVTTSDYGPDSYDFVKDKPITLLNGGNLLAMLHKNGYSGKIDLAEAKVVLKDEENG
jgi:restriction system protein